MSGLVVEVFRSQPALVAAGVNAQSIQRQLVTTWQLPLAAGLDLLLSRCEVTPEAAPLSPRERAARARLRRHYFRRAAARFCATSRARRPVGDATRRGIPPLLAAPTLLLAVELEVPDPAEDLQQAESLVEFVRRWEVETVDDGQHHACHDEVVAFSARLAVLRRKL